MSASSISLRDNFVSYPTERSDSFFAQAWSALRWAVCAVALIAWILLCLCALFFSTPALLAQAQTAAHTSSTTPASPKPNLIVVGGGGGGGGGGGCTSNCGSTYSTTTTLALSIPGSIAVDTAETLTATVTTPNNGSPAAIAPGTITFLDGAKIVGKAQLITSLTSPAVGTATIHHRFSLGSHSISASFAQVTLYQSTGNSLFSASSSAAQSLTVTGQYPSSTTISDPTSTSPYTLAGTVTSEGFPAPTGTISFENASNNNAVLGTASLGAAVPGFASNVTYGGGPGPFSVAVGDFNGDGIPDLAVASPVQSSGAPPGTVSVLLGNGDGTYKTAVNYTLNGYGGYVAIGDFNNDGIPDLVVSGDSGSATNISVLLGNGDGTFQTAVGYNAGYVPAGVAVGDFNGDGNLDLAVADASSDKNVSVLLGNGDGTFGSPSSVAVGSVSYAVAVGDFNGDGKLDLVASGGSSVSVLLGNGDGTFQTQVSYPTGTLPISIAVGDVNGDGILDLAVANSADNTVGVLLGNGNGTFQTQQTFATGIGPLSVAIADLNGDGKPDLAVANEGANNQNTGMFNAGNTVSVLLGDGTGAFGTATSYTVGNAPSSLAARDLNGDGAPDLAVANQYDGTVSVLLNQFTATASLTGVTIPGGGTQNVFASYGGDTNYSGGNSGNLPLQGSQIAPTISFSIGNQTYGEPALVLSASSNSTGAITYSVISGPATIPVNGSMVTFTGIGPVTLQASQAAEGEYTTGTQQTTFTVGQAALTVTAASTSKVYGQADPALTYGITGFVNGDTVAVVSGAPAESTAALTLSPVGPYTITISQGTLSTANYTFGFVNGTLTVNKATSSVLLSGTTTQTDTGTTASLTAKVSPQFTGTPTGTVAFYDGANLLGTVGLVNGVATLTTGVLPDGSDSLTAVYSGDGNFSGNTSNTFVVTGVAPTPVTLQFASTKLVYPLPPAFEVTIAPSGKVAPTGSVEILDGSTVVGTYPVPKFTGGHTFGLVLPSLNVGQHMMTALYSGDKNYAPGISAVVTLTITPGAVSLSLRCNSTRLKTGQSLSCEASATDGPFPVSGTLGYAVSNGPSSSVTLKNGTAALTIADPPSGNDALTITYAAQGNYQAAKPASVSFTVTK